MNKKENKVFDLKEIGYTDLEGIYVLLPFIQTDFANALFNNALSIDMDDFARSIHREGAAPMNEQVKRELNELAPRLWKHRAAQSILEYINK